MKAMLRSHQSRLKSSGSSASLDDRTWTDLDLDAVFSTCDRTASTLGQHAFYHRLRTAPVANNLEAFDALVTRMTTDAAARERAQVALTRLQEQNGYDLWWLSEPDALELPVWYVIFPLLLAGTLLGLLVAAFWLHSWPIAIGALAVTVVTRMATDHRISHAAAAFRQLAPVIATAEALAFLRGDEIDPIVGDLRTETPHLKTLKTISRWVGTNPLLLTLDTTWFALAVSDLINVVYEYIGLALLLDANAIYFGARQVQSHAAALLRCMAAMGDVDAAISVASFRASAGPWVRPRFCPPGSLALLGDIRHPLLTEAVPNTVRLGPPHGILVTGSNMSGKSTLLRTVGVTVVLAQTINTCLAADYEAPVLTVRSCIGRSDDLMSGKSYYLAEVEALLSLVRSSEASAPHLFLLDELFRGTNAVERIAAGEAVLRELILDGGVLKGHVVIAATHDNELVDILNGPYVAFHFGDALGPTGLTFDYQLLPGAATTRNAITLLQLNGAPASLLRCAMERAAVLDRQRKVMSTTPS